MFNKKKYSDTSIFCIFIYKSFNTYLNVKKVKQMNPDIGLILLIAYPVVLVGALILFGKHSVSPD
jgi:hypothetical protein